MNKWQWSPFHPNDFTKDYEEDQTDRRNGVHVPRYRGPEPVVKREAKPAKITAKKR